jgi:Zn-dependent protease with chaperone function
MDMTTQAQVRVERWPTELLLLFAVVVASAGIWLLLAISIIGIVYAALLAAFFFLTHVAFVAYVRGSAVRLGPDQFPELHRRVEELAQRAGLKETPAAYLMQAGGSLNAFATKLFRSRMIVLFSDLLDACGTDEGARDFIVGHEIGHIRAGHLNWMWLILPGMVVPFLGGAYSRARERTCDRYGAALSGDTPGALRGLTVLAAGGQRAPHVNLEAWARQRTDLDTGWMTLAYWLAGYPPLCERVALLDPALGPGGRRVRGPARGFAILFVFALVPVAAASFAINKIAPAFRQAMAEVGRANPTASYRPGAAAAVQQVTIERDTMALAGLAQAVLARDGALPADDVALYEAWTRERPGTDLPLDPFDGARYGYEAHADGSFVLWSSGPDGESDTDDDIVRSWP